MASLSKLETLEITFFFKWWVVFFFKAFIMYVILGHTLPVSSMLDCSISVEPSLPLSTAIPVWIVTGNTNHQLGWGGDCEWQWRFSWHAGQVSTVALAAAVRSLPVWIWPAN